MLDLNLLLVFEAMLLHRNVTAAGAHIGLSQSAMSNALGRLRRDFGDTLFVHTRNGMLPTPRAMELAKPLRQALSLVRASTQDRRRFDPQASRRTFRLCMSDVGEMVFLPPLVRRLDEGGATVKVETAQLSADEIAVRLESGDIDFAAGYLPGLSGAIDQAPLFREHYVCMARRDHPLIRHGTLKLADFLAASHIMIESMGSGHRIIERTLEREGARREVSLRVPHFMVVPTIVACTDRIVTLPYRVATMFSTLVPVMVHKLPLKIPSFDVTLFWHARFGEEPGMRWMRDLLLELFQEPAAAKGARA